MAEVWQFVKVSTFSQHLHDSHGLSHAVAVAVIVTSACSSIAIRVELGSCFSLAEPNDDLSCSLKDLGHQSHLPSLFEIILLIDAQRIDPNNCSLPALPESFERQEEIPTDGHWLAVQIDAVKRWIKAPYVREACIFWSRVLMQADGVQFNIDR